MGRMLIELAAASPDSLEVSQRSSPILKPPVSSIPALCGFASPSLVARSLGARAIAQRATTRSSPGMGINRSGVAPALLRRGKRALACRVATLLPWRPPQLRCLVFSQSGARLPRVRSWRRACASHKLRRIAGAWGGALSRSDLRGKPKKNGALYGEFANLAARCHRVARDRRTGRGARSRPVPRRL